MRDIRISRKTKEKARKKIIVMSPAWDHYVFLTTLLCLQKNIVMWRAWDSDEILMTLLPREFDIVASLCTANV
jgi:hypothetical protein